MAARVAEDAAAASRAGAAVEVACMAALVLAIQWAAPFAPSRRVAYAGLASLLVTLLVACCVRDRVPAREAGFRADNFLRVLRRLAVPFGAAAAALVAAGAVLGTLTIGTRFATMLAAVPAWALLQQYMLLAFANRRLRTVLGPGRPSVVATAALFGALHLPNPALSVATAAAGLLWAREYERDPNLFAHAVTHTLGSAVLANSLPAWLLKNMITGYNFFAK